MIICAAKTALSYKAMYQFLLDMRSKKVPVTVQAKDHIYNDAEEENIGLAHNIASSSK
jgi:hypothetical protein